MFYELLKKYVEIWCIKRWNLHIFNLLTPIAPLVVLKEQQRENLFFKILSKCVTNRYHLLMSFSNNNILHLLLNQKDESIIRGVHPPKSTMHIAYSFLFLHNL